MGALRAFIEKGTLQSMILYTGAWVLAVLALTVVTSASAGEVTAKPAEQVAAIFRVTMLKLDVQAAACKDYVRFDTEQIRQKLSQYSKDVNGFDYFEPMPPKVEELRATLARLPRTDSQALCMDVLRKTIIEYTEVRDVLMRLTRNDGVVPPPIDFE